ncbi:MAG: helix-turn-helix transcriptional regulator [bacterium]|nr:helix-turn-helix transcriptional regulator [bacterium]
MEIKYIKLGNIIRNEREKKGLSQRHLAELASINHSELSKIESGKRKMPHINNLISICEALEINLIDILKIMGIYNKNTKVFDLFVTKTEESKVKINAENEEEVINIIEKYLLGNEYIFEETDENIDIDIEENSNKKPVTTEKSSCNSCDFSCPYCGNCFFEK